MPSIFAYWNPRGLAGHIRLILHYTGEDFYDKRYKDSHQPEKDPESWLNTKDSLGLEFPNLPYYIDGDIKITQSVAIERYLARKYNLVAKTEEDIIKQDNLLYVAVDLQADLLRLAYQPDFELSRNGYVHRLRTVLHQLSSQLGDKAYFIGSKINFVDFHLYEGISINTVLDPSCLEELPNLRAFLTRIENLPRVKEYLSSPLYLKEGICGATAHWGYVPSAPRHS